MTKHKGTECRAIRKPRCKDVNLAHTVPGVDYICDYEAWTEEECSFATFLLFLDINKRNMKNIL